MAALIVSRPEDVHAQAVQAAMGRIGAPCQLLDLSRFPSAMRLTVRFDGGGMSCCVEDSNGERFDLTEFQRIWWRRPQPFRFSKEMTSERARRFAYYESSMAFDGAFLSLGAGWMNPPALQERASQKPYQLLVARRLGFTVPETLITSDPEAARAFLSRYPGRVLQKQMVALPESWRETRRIAEGDMEHLDAVRLTPVQFQKHVEAKADVRVIVVGQQIFAASAAQDGLEYQQDVRMNMNVRWAPHALPQRVQQRLLAMQNVLGLVYGAFDLRWTEEDEYVFLEVNPAGQFLFVEADTGMPISDAVAAWLAGDGAASTASDMSPFAAV